MKKFALISLGIMIYIACFTGYVHASLKKMDTETLKYELIQVKQGETLWKIADRYNERYGTSLIKMLDLIYEVNNLESSMIHPGQTLKIPTK